MADTPDYGRGAQGGAKGHWNEDGSWTWDTGSFAGTTIPVGQAQANKDMYDQSVGDEAAATAAKDAFAKSNGQGKYDGNGQASVYGVADLQGALDGLLQGGEPGAQLDTSLADDDRSRLDGLMAQLQQQAATGSGSWENALKTATARTQADSSALVQSNPGVDYQSALQGIGTAQSGAAQRAVGQGNMLREQAKLDANNQLGAMRAGSGAQDVNQAINQAGARQGARQVNASLEQQAAKNTNQTVEGVAQGLPYVGGIAFGGVKAAGLSDGGKVPGRSNVFGDDEANDTVPAMLSPGEVVLPRSISRDPEGAARFVMALNSRGGAAHLAYGGPAPWKEGDDDVTSQGGINFLGGTKQAPSIRNGALLDTRATMEGRDANIANDAMYAQRAAGAGPSVAPQMLQNARDESLRAALQATQGGGQGAAAAGLGAIAGQAQQQQGAAGDAAVTVAREASSGQSALGKSILSQRERDSQLANAQQRALFSNTQANIGVSLQQQAQLRGLLAGAGQAATGIAAAGGARSGATSGKDSAFNLEPGDKADTGYLDEPAGPEEEPDMPDDDIGYAKGGKVDDERAMTKRLIAAIEQGRKAKPPRAREAKTMSPDEAEAFSADLQNQYLPQQFVVADKGVMAANAKAMESRGGWRDNFFPREELHDPHLETEVSKAAPTTVKPLEWRPISTPSIELKPQKPIYARGPDGEELRPYADIDYPTGDGRGPALADALAETRRMMAAGSQKMAHGGKADKAAAPPLFMPEAGGPAFSYQPADPLAMPERRDAGGQTFTGADLGLGGGFSGSAGISLPSPDDAVPPLTAASPSMQQEARRLNMPVATGSAMAPKAQQTLMQVGTTPDGMPIVEPHTGEMLPDLKTLRAKGGDSAAAAAPAKAGAPAGAVSTPNFGAKADKTARDAAQAQYDADKANADAQAKAAGAQADALESQVLERKATAERVQQRMATAQTRFDAAQQEASNIVTTVDPGRFWASRSTGDRVIGIMGLVLGALGAGPDGVNRAAVMLNQAVDRDIDAQKSEHELRLKKGAAGVDAARSYYAMARDAGQDELAATDLAHAAALRGVAARGQQLIAQTSDPQAKARLAGFIAGIDQGAAQRASTGWEKAQDRALEREKIEATRARSTNPAAKEVQEAQRAYLNVRGTADELKSLIGDTNIVTEKYGTKAARMETLAGSLLLQIKEAEKLGALDKGSIEQAEKIIGDPSATFTLDSTKVAKLNAIIDQSHMKVANAQAVAR